MRYRRAATGYAPIPAPRNFGEAVCDLGFNLAKLLYLTTSGSSGTGFRLSSIAKKLDSNRQLWESCLK
jgi:hypothetical protein